ncbi:MAG: hypothetical protein IJJ50_02955 [Lachnospiraceae bacterium]|nr:hypothetical protein [Lachnospiraceae bacterium]MBR3348851.1 hypothetical protein [Solobacterium sp.]
MASKLETKGKEAAEEVIKKAEPVLKEAKKKAGEAKKKAEPVIEEAKKKVSAAKKKAEPVIEEAKKKAEPVIEEVKKKAEVKTAATKKAAASAGKKAAKAAKTAAEVLTPDKVNVFVQYQGREADAQELAAKAKRIYLEQDSPFGPVGTINLYIKPEDNAAYYVINDAFTGAISL